MNPPAKAEFPALFGPLVPGGRCLRIDTARISPVASFPLPFKSEDES